MPKPASVRDTSIRTYRAKRDFTITAEPAPGEPKPSTEAPLFVVQKHAAKRAGLHWDLRLEHGGVLWSWAVRKGPSLDPADRRLAAHVEDHPLDYADFQGSDPGGPVRRRHGRDLGPRQLGADRRSGGRHAQGRPAIRAAR